MLKNKLNFFLIIFWTLIVLLILYLLFPNTLYNFFIFPITPNKIYLFSDWSVIIAAIKCKLLNYDIFSINPCDIIGRTHVYGSILLSIPYNINLSYFYLFYFPILVNLIFLIIVFSHFNLRNFKELFICFVFIFNPSTLLIMERLNFDIFIFIGIVILCYFRSNILNFFFIIFFTLAKFYPIVISLLFFLPRKREKNFLISIIFFTTCVACIGFLLYQDKNNLIKIFNNKWQFSANYYWSFYFFSLNKIQILRDIFSEIIILIFSFLFCFFFVFFGFSFIKRNFEEKFLDLDYETCLFLISSVVLVSTYFTFNNWTYREIFIFNLLPFILTQSLTNNSFGVLINFIIFRYIFFTISSYYSIFHSNDFLLVFQKILDIFFISFLAGVILFLYLKIFISYFNKKII